MKTLTLLLLFLIFQVSPLSAQCAVMNVDDYAERLNDYQVRGHVQSSFSGACGGSWQPGVRGELWLDDITEVTNTGAEQWGAFSGVISINTPAVSLVTNGPGEYASWGFHRGFCPAATCGIDTYSPPYTGGWDGWWVGAITIERPAISGFCCGNSFWNLGPGSSNPQPTIGGSYAQSVALTIDKKCSPNPSVCTATPQWTLTVNANQTQLSTTTGTSTTISKGSAQGNCQEDSTLKVSIGGFSSGDYKVVVNSPKTIYHSGEATEPWTPGYTTNWSIVVVDACGVNALSAVPVREAFPSAASHQNGGSGYVTPPGSSFPYWDYTDWDTTYTFVDQLGQQGPGQSPSVLYTGSSDPYANTTVYLNAPHSFNVGTTLAGNNGWLVWTGAIRYYRDHGDNNP